MKNETYEEFIAKFNKELPKTTDDCYTPKETYEIIKNHFIEYYNLHNYNIVRPFYPGGDYQNKKYTPKNYITSAQFIKYVKYGVNVKKSDIINVTSKYQNKKMYGSSIVVKEENIPWEI